MNTAFLCRNLVMIAFLCVMHTALFAEHPSKLPAKRDLMIAIQPDGDTLNIFLRGDEKNHFRMTEDGFLILKAENGFYCYAKECRGELKPSARKAKNAEKRSWCDRLYLRKMKKNTLLYKNDWI